MALYPNNELRDFVLVSYGWNGCLCYPCYCHVWRWNFILWGHMYS